MTDPKNKKWEAKKLFILLILIFLLSLPFLNHWIRGDGVMYYAYLRSAILDGDLEFANDYRFGDEKSTVVMAGIGRTGTGKTRNLFGIGASILWLPFFLIGHLAAKIACLAGYELAMDGYTLPYRAAVCFGSALYGFAALLLCFRIASKYFSAKASFLAVVLIWFSSSLPVYMYFLPCLPNCCSFFSVTLFLYLWWIWRDRSGTWPRTFALGLSAALMTMVKFSNLVFILPFVVDEAVRVLRREKGSFRKSMGTGIFHFLCLGAGLAVGLLPHFVVRKVIDGTIFMSGYEGHPMYWASPYIFQVLFSSAHGLFTWTPVLLFGTAGLILFIRRERTVALALLLPYVTLLYIVASWVEWWAGSSFGNRYFIVATPLFVLGIAHIIDAKWRRPASFAFAATGLFLIIWNLFFIFQWGKGLIPREDYISWKDMIRNQFVYVPRYIGTEIAGYFTDRTVYQSELEKENCETWQDTIRNEKRKLKRRDADIPKTKS